MENNKLLFAIFTICIVILVLLVVQMCILVPMAMHSGHDHGNPYPIVSAASAKAPMPAFGWHRFGCHPHKFGHHYPPKHMMPGFKPWDKKPGFKPGFSKDQPKPGVPPKAPAEPQAVPKQSK